MGCLKRLARMELKNFNLKGENNRLRMALDAGVDITSESIKQRNEAMAWVQKLTREVSDIDDMQQWMDDMDSARAWVNKGAGYAVERMLGEAQQ